MAILRVEALMKDYAAGGRATRAVDSVNFTVEPGEFITFVGPSGCGKSTLLHILGGFIPKTSGRILLNGREITGPGPDRGMVFQEPALFPWRTVEDNVTWALEVSGAPRAGRRLVAGRYLEMVNLERFRHHYPHQLSGGMKQRVALARVLAFDPQILLMDEPFGALDAQTRELMQEELNTVWQRTRKTVLFVTHDIDEAVYLADRVVVFTAWPGTIKEIVTIDIPRPRAIEIKKSPVYAELRNRIWDSLRHEVLKSRGEGGSVYGVSSGAAGGEARA